MSNNRGCLLAATVWGQRGVEDGLEQFEIENACLKGLSPPFSGVREEGLRGTPLERNTAVASTADGGHLGLIQ